jgi:hypothetical protein
MSLSQSEAPTYSTLAWELARYCMFGFNPKADERIFALVPLAGETVRATGNTHTEAMRRLAVLLDERAADLDYDRSDGHA